jgi:hypothetical protein
MFVLLKCNMITPSTYVAYSILLAYWLYSIFQGGGEGRLREKYAKSIEPILSEDIR